jgi:putative transcriptional regulator
MVAAQRDIWKASELSRMLADAGLVISAGKMSGLWSSQPITIRLDDLDVICSVLQCTPAELLLPEPEKVAQPPERREGLQEPVAVGQDPIVRRHLGRRQPPR